MIIFENINRCVAQGRWRGPNIPYGYAVSTLSSEEGRLAEVQAMWPELKLDSRHVMSVNEARRFGVIQR